MKKLLLAAALLLLATQAIADTLCENWDDPLGGWRNRWVAQHTNMTNYYICSGSTTDENYRGNNPCGLWICDSDQDFTTAIIYFDNAFGATVTHLTLGIQAFTASTYTVLDMNHNAIQTFNLTTNFNSPYGCYTTAFDVDTPNGCGGFRIDPVGGGQVEGNTAVDNMCVVTGQPTPTKNMSWGQVKAIYR